MIISVTNLKGGVGKTTLCFHFAYLFAEQNKKVLLVDIDPQGNLSSCYLSEIPKKENHVKLLFENEIPLPLKINEKIYLIASDIELSKYELQIKLESYFKLKAYFSLPDVKKTYDVVLVDTPPSLNIFTSNALIASDCTLCVVDPGDFGIMGYKEVKSIVSDIVEKINPSLKIAGLVFNMVKPRTVNFRLVYEKSQNLFGREVFSAYVRYSTVVRDAITKRLTVFEYAPSHTICRDFRKVFEEFLERTC